MTIQTPPWMPELLEAGIHITVMKVNGRVLFDLNLMAKSHLHLYLSDTGWRADMRYNEDHPVNNLSDLVELAKHGMHGREYVNNNWVTLF